MTDFAPLRARARRRWPALLALGAVAAGAAALWWRVESAGAQTPAAAPAGEVAPAPGSAPAAAVPAAQRPSIVILDIDTLRADRLGCYGNPRPTSPAIDRLAAEGVRFEWAFSQAPNTPPSQSSILSSLYPSSHGVKTRKNRLPPEVVTLAESLRDAGYATGGFVDGGYMNRGFGLGQGFHTYDDSGGGLVKIGPKALAWMRDNADKPFLLFVHTYDVHTPYDPPEPYRSMFLAGLAPHTHGFEATSEQMEAIRSSAWTPNPRHLGPNDLAYAMALYDSGIRYVDAWLATLRSELSRLGIADRVVLAVISDHGEEFQEHGSVLHEKLFSTVTHVPLIVRLPGEPQHRVVSTVVEAIDLMPTLIELAGAQPPKRMQGRSLVTALHGGSLEPLPAFSESIWYGGARAVTMGRYHLIYTSATGASEMFDVWRDPHEQRELLKSMPAQVAELRRALHLWGKLVRDEPPPGIASSEINSEAREQLRALGYLH
jgi:arylsulfatase A-like enzyme